MKPSPLELVEVLKEDRHERRDVIPRLLGRCLPIFLKSINTII